MCKLLQKLFGVRPCRNHGNRVLSGVEIIHDERLRQIEWENWSPYHDDKYTKDELAKAAACYALPKRCRNPYWGRQGQPVPHYWPFQQTWWKPSPDTSIDGRIRELAKAGGLIAAEIDRLQRIKYRKD